MNQEFLRPLGPKDLGQGLVTEQVTLAPLPFGTPALVFGIHRRRRDDQMDMRVIVESARMGVQHRDGAGHAGKLPVVLTEGAHGLPGTAHQQIVDDAPLGTGQSPEFGRQGEGDSVALGNHFETFIRDQLDSGRYNNVSEVVRAGLRLLEEREERKQLELDALRAEIAAGRASSPAKSADAVFDRLEAKYAAQANR